MKYLPIVYISLTNRCNSRCIACSYWNLTGPDISPATLNSTLDYLSDFEIGNLIITGGEPTLFKNFITTITELKKRIKPIKLSIMTSGLSLAKLTPSYTGLVDRIVVSLDAHSPELYQDIRGVDGFDQVRKGVLAAARSGIPVDLKTTVYSQNFRLIPEICKVAVSWGASSISFIPCNTTSSVGFARGGQFAPSGPHMSNEELEDLRYLLTTNKLIISLQNTGFVKESQKSLLDLLVNQFLDPQAFRTRIEACNALDTTRIFEADGSIRGCFFTKSLNLDAATNNKNEVEIAMGELHASRLKEADSPCWECTCPYTVDTNVKSAEMPLRRE